MLNVCTHYMFVRCCLSKFRRNLLSAFHFQWLIWLPSLISSWLQRTPLCPSIEPCSKEPLPWRQMSPSGYHLHFNHSFFFCLIFFVCQKWSRYFKKNLTIYRGSVVCACLSVCLKILASFVHRKHFGWFRMMKTMMCTKWFCTYGCMYCIGTEVTVNENTRSLSAWMAFLSSCETALWDGPQTSRRFFRPGSTTMPHSSTGQKYALWTQAGGFWRYWTLYAIWGEHNVMSQNWQNSWIWKKDKTKNECQRNIPSDCLVESVMKVISNKHNRSKEANNKWISVSAD